MSRKKTGRPSEFEVVNGHGNLYSRVREVHFDENWQPKPVIRGVFTGPMFARTTFQVIGVHKIRAEGAEGDEITIDGRKALYTQADRNLLHNLYEKHPWLENFLTTSRSGHLPADVFPSEKYVTSKRKLAFLEENFRKLGMMKLVKPIELLRAKKDNLGFSPMPFPKDWEGLRAYVHEIQDEQNGIREEVRIFGTARCGFAKECQSVEEVREDGYPYVLVYKTGYNRQKLANGVTISVGRSMQLYSL